MSRRGRFFDVPPVAPAPAPPAWVPPILTSTRSRTAHAARRGQIIQVPQTQAPGAGRETLWRLGIPGNGWQFGVPVIS